MGSVILVMIKGLQSQSIERGQNHEPVVIVERNYDYKIHEIPLVNLIRAYLRYGMDGQIRLASL